MPNSDGGETREEYEERLRVVRATQIFGDTPTDPTIGDVVVPTPDEEGAGVDLAAANADAEDVEGEDRDDLLSDEEVKRQGATPQFDDVPVVDDDDADEDSSDDSDDSDDRTAAEVISDIEAADSAEEVDRLSAGDSRVTVQRAADKRKGELA
jgi:hypothetical protein